MALDKLVRDANRYENGVIKQIEMTTADLFCLITEFDEPDFEDKRKDYRGNFKVESKDNSANIFDFFSIKHEFVDKWFKKEYGVTYKGVPLVLYRENRTTLNT